MFIVFKIDLFDTDDTFALPATIYTEILNMKFDISNFTPNQMQGRKNERVYVAHPRAFAPGRHSGDRRRSAHSTSCVMPSTKPYGPELAAPL